MLVNFWSLGVWGGGFASILCFSLSSGNSRMEGFGWCNHPWEAIWRVRQSLDIAPIQHTYIQMSWLQEVSEFSLFPPDIVSNNKSVVSLLLLLCVIIHFISTIIMIVISYFDSDLWVWLYPTQRRTWTVRKLDDFFGKRKLTSLNGGWKRMLFPLPSWLCRKPM